MKAFRIPIMAIMAATILVVPIGISALQHQQAHAPRGCNGCVQFKKLTHEFEKAVISGQWNPGDTPPIRELVEAYARDVTQIFLGGPDTIPGLLEQYQLAVSAVFQNPPDPDKQQKHDQIQEFRQLTHAFEMAVIGAQNPTEPE